MRSPPLLSLAIPLFVLATAACSSPPPPPPEHPEPLPKKDEAPAPQEIPNEPVDTGQACAKASAQCGGGVCEVTVDNTCPAPQTCNLFILSVCQAETDLIQVKARTRETFAAGKKDKVSLSAACQTGRVVSTKVQSLECK